MTNQIYTAPTQTYTAATYMLPDLVEIQRSSFRWFLEEGLIEELNSFSPITDYTGKMELHFLGKNYKLKRPKYDVDEAKRRDSTYAVQMYVPTRLINKETGEIKEQEVFIGDLPLMTDRGTFIINGAERVIVNQIVRSPGVYYKSETDKNGRRSYNASLIPNRGAWLKFETDKNDLVWSESTKPANSQPRCCSKHWDSQTAKSTTPCGTRNTSKKRSRKKDNSAKKKH